MSTIKKYFSLLLLLIIMGFTVVQARPSHSVIFKNTTQAICLVVPAPPGQKMGFFKKILVKIYLKKLKRQLAHNDLGSADKKAQTSLGLGIAALVFLLVPFYTVFLAIPLGIAAIIVGNQALKSGTTKTSKAKLGIGLGIGALVGFLILLIAALIFVATFSLTIPLRFV